MWEAIAALIKSFNEKYLIPFVISVVVAIAAILLLPSDYWMIEKIGKFAFGVAVAGTTFLVVVLFCYVFSQIKKKTNDASERRYIEEQNQKQNEMDIRELWVMMDQFHPEEREVIRELIASGNQPIPRTAYYSSDSIYNSGLMDSATTLDEQNHYSRVYKLKEEYYQFLKYSMDKYHKISNFD